MTLCFVSHRVIVTLNRDTDHNRVTGLAWNLLLLPTNLVSYYLLK